MFKNLTIKIRLFILVAFTIVMMVIIGLIGLRGMSNSNAGLRTVYLDRTIPLDQLAEITDLSADSIIHLHLSGMYDPRLTESNQHDSPLSKHLDQIEQNNQKAAKLWEEYMATYLTPEEKVLAGDYAKLKDDFIKVEYIALDMYKQNRFAEGNVYMIKTVSPKFSGLNEKVDELKSLQVNVAKEEFEKASASYNSMRNIEIGIMLLAVSLGLIMGFIIVRDLVKELGAEPSEVADLIANIARGNLKNEMKVKFGDDRSILANIKVMQESINAFVTAQGEMAEKHADGWISAQIEANKFPGTYGKMAQEINDLVNSHIAVKMQVVKVITEYAKGNFSIDMDRLPGEKAKISEAIDNVKITLSAISSEIKILAEAGVMGDFSRRSDADKFQYMFRDILTDINLLLETCDRGFNDVSRVTEALSKGDLTQTITRDYPGTFGEVKESVNSTIVNLTNMIQEIKQSTEIINTAAKEIASGNNNLSHRAEEQAASLEETASSMEELTSTVKENAHNAQNANRVASNARELAEKGGIVVGSAVKAMQEINESSNKIAAIIGVIDEIAFQTNLLALNASVEAARAGENGRGFSVVATEVRNLAQRSATAARESKALIHNSIQKVRVGTEFVNETGQSLNEIVNGVKEVGAIIADIAAASVQQSSGIEQVNVAVAQMDEITQQNAALAEEASAASVSMSEQTNNMSDLLAFFQLPYSGLSGTGAPLAGTSAPLVGKSAVSASRNTGVAKMASPKKVPVTTSESDDTWDEF